LLPKIARNSPGATDPVTKLNTLATALNEGATVSVTGTFVELICTFPVYVPIPRPAGATETATEDGVVPELGETFNQFPKPLVVAVAVKVKAPPVLVTERTWSAGGVAKVRLEGETCSCAQSEVQPRMNEKRVPPGVAVFKTILLDVNRSSTGVKRWLAG
jgi:hypothetical protein